MGEQSIETRHVMRDNEGFLMTLRKCASNDAYELKDWDTRITVIARFRCSKVFLETFPESCCSEIHGF